jgi:hypothetical protein
MRAMGTHADSDCTQTARRGREICTMLLEKYRSSLLRSRVRRVFEGIGFWAAVPIQIVIRGVWHPGYREQ